MKFFRQLGLAKKLMVIFCVTFMGAMTAIALVFLYSSAYQQSEDYKSHFQLTADLYAGYLNYELLNATPVEIQAHLAGITLSPPLVSMALFDPDKRLVSAHQVEGETKVTESHIVVADQLLWPKPLNSQRSDLFILGHHVHYLKVLSSAGSENNKQLLGFLYLKGDLHHLDHHYSRLSVMLFFVCLLLGGGACFTVYRVQARVLAPLADIVDGFNKVNDNDDFNIKLEKKSEDELGDLIDGFNAMLESIQRRDELLQYHKDKLEEEVALRTKDLTTVNQDLENSIKALMDANDTIRVSEESERVASKSAKAKSQFLAQMSHELRTPMNGVLGMLSLMKETHLNSDQAYYLEIADNSCQVMLTLMNDILDVSKIEEGKLSLENIPFSLESTIDDVFSLLGEAALKKQVELVWYPVKTVTNAIVGDPIRLKQVIFNLLGNAIKFTDSGSIKLEVKQLSVDEQSQELLFELTDTGIGIKDEAKEKIFESFSQADESTTRNYGGTGLGLTLCRQLVALMGGEIGVRSVWGEGSTFWFSVSFELSKQSESNLFPLVTDQSKRVLVLDDSDESLTAAANYLDRLGIKSKCIHSIEACLSQLHSNQVYDAILIDVSLPGSGLPQLVEDIGSALPTVFMGAVSDPAFVLAKDLVRDPFILNKPLRFAAMRQVFARALHIDEPSLEVNETILTSENEVASSDALFEDSDDTPEVSVARSILVVEDNVVNQKVIMCRLEKSGHAVEVAHNGEKACELLAANQYDLVFMDCQMPVMDGFEATEVIRARQKEGEYPHVPIVAMTASVMQGDRERCLASGMDDYLSKPIKNDDLQQILIRWLRS